MSSQLKSADPHVFIVDVQRGGTQPSLFFSFFFNFRRTNREIICITPASSSGSGPASIRLMIDKAEVTSSETKYVYTEDPTISSIEPNWTILK